MDMTSACRGRSASATGATGAPKLSLVAVSHSPADNAASCVAAAAATASASASACATAMAAAPRTPSAASGGICRAAESIANRNAARAPIGKAPLLPPPPQPLPPGVATVSNGGATPASATVQPDSVGERRSRRNIAAGGGSPASTRTRWRVPLDCTAASAWATTSAAAVLSSGTTKVPPPNRISLSALAAAAAACSVAGADLLAMQGDESRRSTFKLLPMSNKGSRLPNACSSAATAAGWPASGGTPRGSCAAARATGAAKHTFAGSVCSSGDATAASATAGALANSVPGPLGAGPEAAAWVEGAAPSARRNAVLSTFPDAVVGSLRSTNTRAGTL
eukprot:365362-Chlamydomonas_euryale.AAC.1